MTQQTSRPIACKSSVQNELIERVMLGLENHWLDSSPVALTALRTLAAEPNGLALLGQLLLEHASRRSIMFDHQPSDRLGRLHHAGHRVVRCEKCRRRRVGRSWVHQPAPRGWIVANGICPDCDPDEAPKPLPEIRIRPLAAAVDQIARVIDAGYWNWDEEACREALLELDEAALALVGEMWRLMALLGQPDDATGLADPPDVLFNGAIVYSRHGANPEIAARFRDLVDESLHEEQIARMVATAEVGS